MLGIDDAIAAATGLLNTAITRIWPDPTDRAKAEVMQLTAAVDGAMQIITAQTSVIIAEANGDGFLQRSWRPITMLTFLALVVADFLGFRAPGVSPEIEARLFELIQLGLGGYVIGRSAEKISGTVAEVMAKSRKA